VNGAFVAHHEEGYTSVIVYIHNASEPLRYGAENVMTVFVDGTQSELWAYEGNGIYRHVWIESAPLVSITPWSFYAPSYVSGTISGTDASLPQSADGALLIPQVDIQNAGARAAVGTVIFVLHSPRDAAVVLNATAPFNISMGGWQRITTGPMPFGSAVDPVLLWNTALGTRSTSGHTRSGFVSTHGPKPSHLLLLCRPTLVHGVGDRLDRRECRRCDLDQNRRAQRYVRCPGRVCAEWCEGIP
jgi:hypothetical protein